MIRAATLADVPRCVEMGAAFLHSSGYAELLQDNPAQMRAMATRLLTGPESVLLVAEWDGWITGMFGALCFPHPLSGERTASELFFWCEPHHGAAGLYLLKEAERWAATQGAVRMHMIQPVKEPRVGRLYQRLGYVPIEHAWSRTL